MNPEPLPSIETYPVGVLQAYLIMKSRLKHDRARFGTRYIVRAFRAQIKTHWKRKSFWNGYLTEMHYPPEGLIQHKCGHGWTRKRSQKRFGIYLAESNPVRSY